MLKRISFLLLLLAFSCSTEESAEEGGDAKNPIYLDSNGVTIKAHSWAEIGDTGVINGKTYEIVDQKKLEEMACSMEGGGNPCGDFSKVVTSRITSLNNIFAQRSEFNQDISHWDVSNVTDMAGLFYANAKFNQDLSYWDVSKVTTMDAMFSYCSVYNNNISKWNTSNVTIMQLMFEQAKVFSQDLSSWCVEKIKSEPSTFTTNDDWKNSHKPKWGEPCN